MKRKFDKEVFGMVHLRALPGTPQNSLNISRITEIAISEAQLLMDSGFDGIILENMHDIPYPRRETGPEIIAACSVIASAIHKHIPAKTGIQILAGANKAALSVAHAAQLDFIRAEGFVFSQISDEGQMDADSASLMRYRKYLAAQNIKVFCDIKKKHAAHAITSDVSISEMAKAAEFFLADGVIVTGSSTGIPASIKEISEVQNAVTCPVWIGSGLTADNISSYWQIADGFIVGSYLKQDGLWSNELSPSRCKKFIDQVNILRNKG